MANLNKVHLIGNLTRDPETTYSPKGTAIGQFGLAVNRRVKDASDNWTDEVTFIDITAFGKTAEFVQQYITKGGSVFVEGRLQLDTWEDKQSGQKRSKLKVIAENVQGLSRKGEGGDTSTNNGRGGRDVPASEARMKHQQAKQDGYQRDNSASDDVEDHIPFSPKPAPFQP